MVEPNRDDEEVKGHMLHRPGTDPKSGVVNSMELTANVAGAQSDDDEDVQGHMLHRPGHTVGIAGVAGIQPDDDEDDVQGHKLG